MTDTDKKNSANTAHLIYTQFNSIQFNKLYFNLIHIADIGTNSEIKNYNNLTRCTYIIQIAVEGEIYAFGQIVQHGILSGICRGGYHFWSCWVRGRRMMGVEGACNC